MMLELLLAYAAYGAEQHPIHDEDIAEIRVFTKIWQSLGRTQLEDLYLSTLPHIEPKFLLLLKERGAGRVQNIGHRTGPCSFYAFLDCT